MTSFLSSWAQQIIFAVVIGVVIQMLVPEGKSKKYIKICIGIYVLFTVISPVAGKDIEIDFNSINISIENTVYSSEETTQASINEIYIANLKEDIIAKLKTKGYSCEGVELTVDSNYNIEKIVIKGLSEYEEKVSTINEIIIGNSVASENSSVSSSDKDELKKYISETYDVKEANISI